MTYLLLQTFLLLMASYFLGAFVACLAKRMLFGAGATDAEDMLVPAQADVAAPPVVVPPQPVGRRAAQPSFQSVAPRAIDPVQPKIEVLRRPEPRPAPAVLDPSRFERALTGPDFNEGVPRIAVAEIRPAVLKPVTGIYKPKPPEPPPVPDVPIEVAAAEPAVEHVEDTADVVAEEEVIAKTEPRPGGLAARLRDATTAAAAGAVAAAKAAAAASIAFPTMGSSRKSGVGQAKDAETSSDTSETANSEVSNAAGAETDLDKFHATQPPVESELPEADDKTGSTEYVSALGHGIEQELAADAAQEEQPEPEVSAALEPEPEARPPEQVQPAATIEEGDDFQRIRAIDGNIEQHLKSRGIIYFEHIAAWSASDVRRVGQELDLPGRIEREQWVEQAQILAKGGETYYSRNRRAMLKAAAEASGAVPMAGQQEVGSSDPASNRKDSPPQQTSTALQAEPLVGVAAASQGRSVAEMAAAAAAAIAASSASVTRGLKPIEPISPLSKVDPKLSMPARITDAIREKESSVTTVEIVKESLPQAPDDDAGSDDLKRIRGIGVLIEKRLHAMGIRRYDQIANWTSGDIDRVSRMLEFKGRIERESWVEQARILASGGQTEFSRRVDKGEVDTSREA
ncbi:hypothetical protein [Hyphomicrobium sp.]|uniref:hypothetical protein n=1 Tax=Hyphomicrobium sp. TaxID=82 RepID=UPI000FB21A16|nr:hypothetical protein [Hyphomicrobium sp.]RUP00729.1 MAG: hypothetical protein EKK30_01195 [Hyphomicrobium sp.]